MSGEVPGRLVEVQTRFHSQAVKPGGVSRAGAVKAAERSVANLEGRFNRQVADNVAALVGLLRDWRPDLAEQGCVWASVVRDVAGLTQRHLLTDVAMYCFDCLDSVAMDGKPMDAAEAACFADALSFASQDHCRGDDLAPYSALLKELDALTGLVVGRVAP